MSAGPAGVTIVVDSEGVPPQVAQLASRLSVARLGPVKVALSGREPRKRPQTLAFIQRLEAGLMRLSGRSPVEYAPTRLRATTGLAHPASFYINASESVDDASLAALVNAPVLSSTATRGGHLLGFNEVFAAERGSWFEVCLTTAGQATRRIASGRLQTQLFYLENLQSLAAHANHYLMEFLRDGERRHADAPAPPTRAPASPSVGSYLPRLVARFTSKALPRLAGRRLTWNIATCRTGSAPTVLQNPPGSFSADPFVIEYHGEVYCFVEELSFTRPSGIIVCYRIRDGLFERLGVALEEPFHLSFPFLFEANGSLFMCPESSTNRDVRIYRCTNFPLEWSLHHIALDGISAVDTVILRREERWWMITCVNPLGTGTQFSELCAFSASGLEGPWTAHAGNPLRIDEVEGRNGGFFEAGGKSYRVNQVQGFGIYGESIGINEIVQIDDRAYQERAVPVDALILRPDVIGIHHMSRCNDTTVFDFSTSRR